MEVSRKDLEERYAELNDDALLSRYSSGTLTELAAAVAREELERRGIPLPQPPAPEAPEPEPPAPPDIASAGSLVTISAKLNWFEANILCSLLHSEGIPAQLADTHLATAHHFLSFATGGIRIFVPERSVARVREIAAAFQRGEYSLDDDATDEPAKP
jgi:hypothetical protein